MGHDFVRWTLISVCLVLVVSPVAAQGDWFPFTLPWDDDEKTFVDASHLLLDYQGQDPATLIDSRGFVRAGGDGRFYFEKTGRRARFWGVNLVFNANFPDFESAEKLARRLAKLGFNVVRFHHMDFFASPDGIFDPKYFPNSTRHLDAEQVSRWDHLVHQLRRNGIYVNVNLKVARHFGPGDGVFDTHRFTENRFYRGVSHYNRRMIELQEEFARRLLDRTNPFTGLAYAEDPAVFCIEIANEDSLFGSLLTDGEINFLPDVSTSLPEAYSRELDDLWNAWLRDRYAGEEALRRAWEPDETPAEPGDRMRNGDFSQGLDHWDFHTHGQAGLTTRVEPATGPGGLPALRIEVRSDGVNWHVQAAQTRHSVEEGRRYEISFHARALRTGGITIDMMRGAPPWENFGLGQRFVLGPEWRRYRARFIANTTDFDTARPTFELGETDNTIWLAQVEFREVNSLTLEENESLDDGTIGRPLRSDFGRYSDGRVLDLLRFYFEVDSEYFTGMRRYLREALGMRALVTGTAPWWSFLGDIAVQAQLDFVDGHYYWDHPWWPSVPAWSPRGWFMGNRPFVNDLGSLAGLASQAVHGKPFTVSEYNQPFPNRYALEGPLLMALIGNQQDWDAVYLFDYAGSTAAYRHTYTTTFFSLSGNPIKAAQMPIASRIFLGRQNSPSPGLFEHDLRLDEVLEGYGRGHVNSGDFLDSRGFDRSSFLERRLRVRFSAQPGPPLEHAPESGTVRSDHGELSWDRSDPLRSFVSVSAEAVEGAIGFIKGRNLEFPGWGVSVDGRSPDHAAVILQSADGTPLRESRRLLLSLWSEHQNTGMIWNHEHTSVDDRWGGAPTIVRPLEARFVFAFPSSSGLRVYPLDATGRRGESIPPSPGIETGVYRLDTGRDRTVWYELELSPPSIDVEYSLEGGGLFQLFTEAGSPALDVGWIRLEESAPATAVTALMEYHSRGVLTSIVGVPAAAPRDRWWFPVRREGRLGTAVALVNPSMGETLVVHLSLRDAEGGALEQAQVSIPPGSVDAFFLWERLSVPDEPFLGSLQAVGTHSFACLALRSRVTTAGEYILTPVSVRPSGASPEGLFLPQLAAGPDYSTDVVWFNPEPAPVAVMLELFNPDGSPADPRHLDDPVISLAEGQTRLVELPRGDSEFYGYGRLTPAEGRALPQVSAVVTRWGGEDPLSEAGIPPSAAVSRFHFVGLERTLQWTALALLNPGTEPLDVEVEVRSQEGLRPESFHGSLRLGGHERRSMFLRELIEELPHYVNASVEVRGARPFGFLPLLGAFNSRGTFLLASLQDEHRGDGDERIIARFLSGRGYRTMFFASDLDALGGRLSFFDTEGKALTLTFR
jgi:hypothetical protein